MDKKNRFAPLFVIIAASLWGFDGIVLRPYLSNLPVPLVVFIEVSLIFLGSIPFLLKKLPAIMDITAKQWLPLVGAALFGGVIGTMCIVKALFFVNFVNLSIVVFLQKLQPIFALSLAALLLKERLPRNFFLWAVLAIAGSYFVTFGFNLPNFATGDKTSMAALYAITAAFSFGFATVLGKGALRNVNSSIATFLRFTLTMLIMLTVVLMTGSFSSVSEITGNQWIVFLVIALGIEGFAFYLYYYGLQKITASVSTICELAFPFTAVLLEYLIRGNILGPVQWIGGLILLYSIFRVTIISRNRRRKEESELKAQEQTN